MDEHDMKPSDFLHADASMVPVPRIALGLLLGTCQSYFKLHNMLLKAEKEGKRPRESDLMLETLLSSQIYRAVAIVYAAMPNEERLLVIREAEKMILENPNGLPKIPDMEELF